MMTASYFSRGSILVLWIVWLLSDSQTFAQQAALKPLFDRTLEMPENHGDFRVLALSPNGKILAAGTSTFELEERPFGGEVFLWDLDSLELIHTIDSHQSTVGFVKFTADGERLISICDDKLISIWDLPNASVANSFHYEDRQGTLAVDPVVSENGELLACVQKEERQFENDSVSVHGTLTVMDLSTGKTIWSLPRSNVQSLAFSPDGKKLVVSVEEMEWIETDNGGLSGRPISTRTAMLNARSGKVIWSRELKSAPEALTFLPNGKSFAGTKSDAFVRWSTASGKTVQKFDVGLSAKTLKFDQNGKKFGIATTDRVELWNRRTEQRENSLEPVSSIIKRFVSLEFSSDLKRIVHKSDNQITFDWMQDDSSRTNPSIPVPAPLGSSPELPDLVLPDR